MRILVVADTHGSPDLLLHAVRHAGDTNMLLHLGDGQRDCTVLENRYKGEIWKVRGNCDFLSADADVNDRLLALDGALLFMTHGHLYDAKATLNRLWLKGREAGVDVVCFGHTHVPLLQKRGDVTLLNPGSLRHGRTYGLIELNDGKVKTHIKSMNHP